MATQTFTITIKSELNPYVYLSVTVKHFKDFY